MQNISVLTKENVNENVTAYIEATLGDSHVNMTTLIPLTIIYSIFLIVGICGNLSTCIVIISNEYMRTPTNAYLLNLAIADIATLIISKLQYTSLVAPEKLTIVVVCVCGGWGEKRSNFWDTQTDRRTEVHIEVVPT